ncbi:DNA repair protein RadC (plasmid) [Peribacillus asahii]|nr:DNA repair protein RadC [Peribacillus asahii]USK72762.1 DNA repair protein RadC [Peribacillus asahii]
MYHIPQSINSPQDAFDTIMGIMDLEKETQELFGVLALNTKNKVIGFDIIHKGTVNASMVSSRDVFKCLLLRNATSFICFHNHPSGDPSPSGEDIEVTKKLKSAGEMIDIKLLDHIITGDHGKYVSLKEKGVL